MVVIIDSVRVQRNPDPRRGIRLSFAEVRNAFRIYLVSSLELPYLFPLKSISFDVVYIKKESRCDFDVKLMFRKSWEVSKSINACRFHPGSETFFNDFLDEYNLNLR